MDFFKLIGKAFQIGQSLLYDAIDESERKANALLDKQESKLNWAEKTHTVNIDKINERRQAINTARNNLYRRTDEELEQDKSGLDKNPTDFSYETKVLLSDAIHEAPSAPGVYILWLNGSVMKCGRASYSGGVRWRFAQYYNLNYDNKSRAGNHWSVSEENRDFIKVSWQCCPPSKCHELEYKLFKKYGKGPWAERAPNSCDTNSWQLLI